MGTPWPLVALKVAACSAAAGLLAAFFVGWLVAALIGVVVFWAILTAATWEG